MIRYLQCNNNNLAATVLHLFLNTISIHCLPSRVRADFSVKKVDVAQFILDCPEGDIKRESFIAGTFVHNRESYVARFMLDCPEGGVKKESLHNQCIEGLWDEVIRCVVRHFRNIFLFLENEGFLDLLNEVHLLALHDSYMHHIKKVLEEFSNDWRYYPLSIGRNLSPYQFLNYGMTRLIH